MRVLNFVKPVVVTLRNGCEVTLTYLAEDDIRLELRSSSGEWLADGEVPPSEIFPLLSTWGETSG